MNIYKAVAKKVDIISNISTILVEVTKQYKGNRRSTYTEYYTVTFSEKEQAIINACYDTKVSYHFLRKCIENTAISRVKQCIDLNIGKPYQSRLVSIKILK